LLNPDATRPIAVPESGAIEPQEVIGDGGVFIGRALLRGKICPQKLLRSGVDVVVGEPAVADGRGQDTLMTHRAGHRCRRRAFRTALGEWIATDSRSLPTATTDRAFDIVREHVNQ
jgi:hypothetical protein